jgi:hypothetical protein
MAKMPAKKPIPKLIWDEAYWHHRAEEARTIADRLDNAECKRIMTGIAESYQRLAELTMAFRITAQQKAQN